MRVTDANIARCRAQTSLPRVSWMEKWMGCTSTSTTVVLVYPVVYPAPTRWGPQWIRCLWRIISHVIWWRVRLSCMFISLMYDAVSWFILYHVSNYTSYNCTSCLIGWTWSSKFPSESGLLQWPKWTKNKLILLIFGPSRVRPTTALWVTTDCFWDGHVRLVIWQWTHLHPWKVVML